MRDPVNVFYYPEMVPDFSTLKKAILFFDDIHFIDRPSFMFGPFVGGDQFGMVGTTSPMRQFEKPFRDEGVPVFVHGAPGGPVPDELYDQIKADVNDPVFLARFQEGIGRSQRFRDLQIAHGNYGQFGTHEDVARKVLAVDLATALNGHSAVVLFEDSKVRPFDLSTPLGCAKNLISQAVTCSAKMNFALAVSSSEAIVPLADASPYGDLLGAKYARAIRALEPTKAQIQLTDLTLSVFYELVPTERIEALTLKDMVTYRKAAKVAREEFLEHLSVIHAKQASIGADGDYSGAIDRILTTEILPAAQTFKKRLQTIGESLYGALAKGVLGYAGTSAGISVFGDLSWEKLLALAGPAGVYIANAAIDALLAQRAARRECSISYVLSLDK